MPVNPNNDYDVSIPLYELTFVKGDDFYRQIAIVDSDGAPIDISSYDFAMQWRTAYGAVSSLFSLTVGSGLTKENSAGGILSFSIAAALTANISISAARTPPFTVLYADLEITPSGGLKETRALFKITVYDQITQ